MTMATLAPRDDAANPTTPTYTDDLQWMTAYLTIHMLSANSRVYMYLLWAAFAAVLLICTALHLSPARRSSLAARWTKWAIRRRTWRGKHIANLAARKGARITPHSLPANGQILALVGIFIAALVLAFVGPDYLTPTAPLFSFQRRAIYDVSWYTQYQPTYTIPKAWWTAGGRTGLIAFALFPLCVLFALKAPPFALLALPFTVQMHFDKLSWLHRWTAYLIYLLTVLHVALWSVQLATEKREYTGKVAYTYAFGYQKFIYGWIAFGSMTLLILCSLYPIRRYHYESFYIMHVILIPCTLVMSALHHPPVAIWCWAALAAWIGERAYRGVWWLNTNGFLFPPAHKAPPQIQPFPKGPSNAYPPAPPPPPPMPDLPPPGIVRAELLAGATTRLTMLPAGPLSWAPGQHFLINVPAVAPLPITHPFTVASAEGGPLVFLIRAKDGWTRDLWDFVARAGGNTTTRMLVEGPFGSAARARWGRHHTVVIVVGGAGVAYGLSVLAHICEGLVRGGMATRRVRFVWLMREFSHLTWCATELRRYMEMVPEPALEVNIFVTSAVRPERPPKPPYAGLGKDASPKSVTHLISPSTASTSYDYSPRNTDYNPYTPSASPGPSDIADADDAYVDLSYYTGEFGDEEARPGGPGENYTRDLTDFEGDEGGDSRRLSGEARLSRRVQRAGRNLRAQSRMLRMSVSGFKDIMPDESGRMPDAAHLAHARQELGSRGSTAELLGEDSELAYARASHIGEVDLGATRFPLANQLPPLLEDSDDERSVYEPESRLSTGLTMSRGTTPDLHVSTSQLGLGQSQMGGSSRRSSTLVDDTRPNTPWSAFGDEKHLLDVEAPQLHVEADELRDVARVSEFARPGKPRIDRILADEVERSKGSVVVACCGPTSLSAMVRKAVADQIRPDRVRKGDPRGMIELHTEDFGY